ncbi:hypothetical protein DR085_01405 [Mycoplasma flocculare]|nr:hypothetical protein [Mesomycoplasma flocculare]
MIKSSSWYILFTLIIFFLIQFFIFFIYRVNLKIKYSKLEISTKLDLEVIKKDFIEKYQQNFSILLINDFFLKPIWIKKKIIKIPNFYLENHIYGVVNLAFFYNFYLLKKDNLIDLLVFSSFFAAFHLSFLFGFLNFLWISGGFLVLSIFVILLDFVLNGKFYTLAYKKTKVELNSKLEKNEFRVVFSYLKYKKLAFFKKYFLFYPFLFQNLVKQINNLGR